MRLLCLSVLLSVVPLQAQFLPQLQATTPAEFDAYLDVIEAPAAAQETVGRAFLDRYPDSDLRLPVLEIVAEASRNRGDAPVARLAAIEGLRLAPEYIPLLTLLAAVEANTMPAPEGGAAREALRLLDQARAPRTLDAEQWRAALAHLRAVNLMTLGIVAFKRGDRNGAIAKLEEALRWEESPAAQYRLALLYLEAKRGAEGRALLQHVTRSEDAALAALARQALQR